MNLRGKTFLAFFTISLLATACAGPETPATAITASAPTQPLDATLTAAAHPTISPEASPVPTLAPTPQPGLRTDGPYLTYFSNADEQRQLVLMDADGVGRKVIPWPFENEPWLHFISPDAKWLAYYLGSAQNEQDSELTLNLLNLQTSESQLVASLLSDDYPNNFIEAAETVNDPFRTAENIAANLKETFIGGITNSIGWSPNSRYLAFAGQMDGLSSDIYLYDLETKETRRLTRGPEQIQGIEWSPDGKWILSSSATEYGAGGGYEEDAIAFGSFTMKPLPFRNNGVERQWNDNHSYLQYDNQNVIGDHNFQLVDLETGKTRAIWDGMANYAVFDPEMDLLIFWADTKVLPLSDNPSSFIPGSYLINTMNGKETRLEDFFSRNTWLLGMGNYRFFTKHGQEAYFISADGTLIPAEEDIDNVSAAPNRQYWASIGETLKVFDVNHKLIRDVALPFVTLPSEAFRINSYLLTIWQPDSSGFFIAINEQLYHFNLQTTEVNLVETYLMLDKGLTFTALSQK